MGPRRRLQRLEKAAQGKLGYFVLREGGRYWFDPDSAHIELFTHSMNSMRADYGGEPRPHPPEIMRALARAKDRKAALEGLYSEEGSMPLSAYNLEALVERGELVPRSFVASREVGERPEDLSEDPRD
jgi:hypothetical protein